MWPHVLFEFKPLFFYVQVPAEAAEGIWEPLE
jgi:hypothetical protein